MTWRNKLASLDDGRYFPGVPGRDLTDEEMDAAEARHPGLKESEWFEYVADGDHPVIARRTAAAAEADTYGAVPVPIPDAAMRPIDVLPVPGEDAPDGPDEPGNEG